MFYTNLYLHLLILLSISTLKFLLKIFNKHLKENVISKEREEYESTSNIRTINTWNCANVYNRRRILRKYLYAWSEIS
jgi:hypothetical protein